MKLIYIAALATFIGFSALSLWAVIFNQEYQMYTWHVVYDGKDAGTIQADTEFGARMIYSARNKVDVRLVSARLVEPTKE